MCSFVEFSHGLNIVNDCSHATMTEMSSYNRDHIDHKAENISYLALYRKSILIPAIVYILCFSVLIGQWKHTHALTHTHTHTHTQTHTHSSICSGLWRTD